MHWVTTETPMRSKSLPLFWSPDAPLRVSAMVAYCTPRRFPSDYPADRQVRAARLSTPRPGARFSHRHDETIGALSIAQVLPRFGDDCE